MNEVAYWLDKAKGHYDFGTIQNGLLAVLIALVMVLMNHESTHEERAMKTEYKDPLFKEAKENDQE